jgi:hypothetical protein
MNSRENAAVAIIFALVMFAYIAASYLDQIGG